MEISKTECKRILRTLELKAYRSVVDALRAQGALTANKNGVLKNLAATLKVGEERYRSEMRRAANDDLLNTIAQSTSGQNTEAEWQSESAKKVPLTPMVASHTTFTVLADAISDIVSLENEKFSDSGTSKHVLESYKFRNDDNLEKYQSSKALDSLLMKRKNHHQNLILSELENIKSNNNYHTSPIKSGYIEIAYDDTPCTVETPNEHFSFEDTNSSFDAPSCSLYEKSKSSVNNFPARNFEDANTCDKVERKKSRLKLKREETKSNGKILLNSNESRIQNTGRTRNLRSKPLRKYTWNSVEIKSFDEKNAGEADSPKFEDNESVKGKRGITGKEQNALNSKESQVNISNSESGNNKSMKSKKSMQRNRSRTKFIRQSKISRVRKLAPSSKGKIDSKEVPSRTARFSSRNARRRNYARIASGDYDLLEFERIRKEKNIENIQIKTESDDIKESDDDMLSDSSAAPIEISYGVLAAPKNSDYDLDGVSSNYTETDDDMKPHTFNLIPASRRLKMLKKRASSPTGEETPAKLVSLTSPLIEEQGVTPAAKPSLLDANALKKVLGIHESLENVTSSSLSDVSDVADTKDNLDTSDGLHSSRSSMDVRVTKPTSLNSSRPISAKKLGKPKMKLSEASTIENLNSLLFKVKEGDVKRLPSESSNKKTAAIKRRKDRKSIVQPASPIVNICEGALIEVGSDIGSPKSTNCDASIKSESIDDRTRLEKNDRMETKNEKRESQHVSINEEEIVNVTLDCIKTQTNGRVSEQLIDIESADIIIGDNDGQNDEFILANSNATILESNLNNKPDSVPVNAVEILQSSTTSVETNRKQEQKSDVAENCKSKREDLNAPVIQNGTTLMQKTGENIKAKMGVSVDFQPVIKKVLPTSADFRYIADADDPSLKTLLSKSSSSHSIPTTVPSQTATIINSNKKFGKQSANNPMQIIINNAKIVNNGSTLLQNKITEPSLVNSNAYSKDRQFVLLKTSSITGSKSLLKPFKIFPKTVIPNQATTEINCVTQKPKTLAVYSPLSSVGLPSVGSKTVKDAVVSSSKSTDFPSTNINKSVTTKSASEIDSKRLVLSQALETSLKLIGTSKTPFENTSVDMSEYSNSLKNDDKMIEISSNDSSKVNLISKDDNCPSVSSTTTANNFDILFTDGVILSEDLSNNPSSAGKQNEIQTFFSKNIIRKQS